MEIKLINAFLIAVLALPLLCSGARAGSAADAVTLHYHRQDGDYGGWKIWSWSVPEGVTAELEQSGADAFGVSFVIELSKYKGAARIGMLPKYKQWESKDDPNRFIEIDKLRAAGRSDIYIVSGRKEVFMERPDISPFIKNAFLDGENEIIAVLSKKIGVRAAAGVKTTVSWLNGVRTFAVSSVELVDDAGNVIYEAVSHGAAHEKRHHRQAESADAVRSPFKSFAHEKNETRRSNILKITLADKIEYNFSSAPPEIEVAIDGFIPVRLKLRNILYSNDFRYDGELGCLYDKNCSVFRVFAPSASAVDLVLYDRHDSPESASRAMEKEHGGVWSTRVEGDLAGRYYKYRTVINGETNLGLDPYSKCNTAHNGRALIVDDKTPITDPPVFSIDKAVIYEMHIRDFTIDEKTTVKNRGKFLGAVEEKTVHSGDHSVKTGIGHLMELGVNTVQILPFQDFENDEKSDAYNWGYMPVNFNSPDGWYASETTDASRVVECKKTIDAFHRNGIKVVMDVVYNHTAEGNEQVRHSFNALAPSYYYRVKLNGDYWNGSGCGNEFKSESYMGRKFLIDSLKYWVKEYKIDGFRFDLMGLIDTDSVYLLTEELKKINPDIFVYGEPWAASSAGIEPTVKGAQRDRGFAVFNDIFRDAIKGSVWNDKGGYVQGTVGVENIERGAIGSILDFAASPLETINYCEAHDNRTLYDKLLHTTGYDKSITSEKIEKMHKLACFLVLTSQGVPFIHAGQEMMRSKDGEENSYNKPDNINKISWDLKIENAGVVELVKELIALRNAHPMLRMKTAAQIHDNVKFLTHDLKLPVAAKCLAYLIRRGELNDEWKAILILANPRRDTIKFILPEENWKVFYHDGKFRPFVKIDSRLPEIELAPISSAILYAE